MPRKAITVLHQPQAAPHLKMDGDFLPIVSVHRALRTMLPTVQWANKGPKIYDTNQSPTALTHLSAASRGVQGICCN